MNIGIVNLLVCMSVASVSQQTYTNETVNVDSNISTNDVLVVFSTEESLKWKDYTVDDFKEVECTAVEDLTSSYKHQKILKKDFKRILKLSFGEKEVEEVYNIIDKLSAIQGIEYAGPNYELIGEASAIDTTGRYNSRTATSVDENWGIDRINVPEAESYIELLECETKTINVGVLEKGIDGTHNDFNGKKNTVLSESFYGIWSSVDELNEWIDSDGQSSDHGTMVAGIIAANENSTEGTRGVCHDARIVSLKFGFGISRVAGSNEYIYTNVEHVVSAFNHATLNNIRIMNCSFGYVLYDSAMFAAMYNYPGLIVCGAGNDGSNNDTTPFYPASFDLDNIISVGAIDINNNKWTYSNHGKTSVDVFAPGVDIKSTSKNNTYKVDSGTSYAAPFVSGLAAMLLSIEDETPAGDLTALEIKGLIMDSAVCNSNLEDYCVTESIINAEEAVSYALEYIRTYTYSQYDSTYHVVMTGYGDEYLEEHLYVPVTSSGGMISTYIPPTILYYQCSKCGATKLSL